MTYRYHTGLAEVGLLAEGITGELTPGTSPGAMKSKSCKLTGIPQVCGAPWMSVDLRLDGNTLTISDDGSFDRMGAIPDGPLSIELTAMFDEFSGDFDGYDIELTGIGSDVFALAIGIGLRITLREHRKVIDGQHRYTAVGNLITLSRDITMSEVVEVLINPPPVTEMVRRQ
ncbi:protein of unknown function [Magnetospirillum sp. XM-1]|nr:protein of unknown function [Magnetospirillum sp. XM-1]